MFFFGDAQLNRESEGGSIADASNGQPFTSVPTAANRNGNFQDYLAYGSQYIIYNPTTGDQNGVGRIPFPNNTIPAVGAPGASLSPQALAIMKNWPGPTSSGQIANADFANNFTETATPPLQALLDTREDYYLNAKNTIFGRYSYGAYTESAPGAFGLLAGGPSFGHYAGSSQALNQSLAVGWTYTATATLVNEFRLGWEKYHVFDVPNGYGTQPAATAGIPGLNLDKTYTSGLPAFYINNPTGNRDELGYSLGINQCNCPLTETESQFQFVDNVTKVSGKHTLKFGADIRYARNLRVPSDSHRAGELTFTNAQTGDVCPYGVGVIHLAEKLLARSAATLSAVAGWPLSCWAT